MRKSIKEQLGKYNTGDVEIEIVDNSDDPKFFHMMPFLVTDMFADGFISKNAYVLYSFIKRVVCEEGTFFMTTRNIANTCRMHTEEIADAKKELAKYGLITIKEYTSGRGRPGHKITITRVWSDNYKAYKDTSVGEVAKDMEEAVKKASGNKNSETVL